MQYQMLPKVYYQNRSHYEEEVRLRKTSDASVDLAFQVHGDDAFYMVVPELLRQQGKIYKEYLEFINVFQRLPAVAQECYCRKCLIDEIVLTNDLEGVHSSRRDVLDVLQTESKEKTDSRFDGLVRKYCMLIEDARNAEISLDSLQDIRDLYDEIVLPEIKPTDHPDGLYFRTGSVSVCTVTDKVKHQGISGEENINEHMRRMLAILKEEQHADISKIAIAHYMFGYVHPFYDGNGRLSRFISSYLLAKTFNPIVAYRLSYTIKQNKSLYYDAFDYVNDRHSSGDVTPFILVFSELVCKSIESLTERVTSGSEQLAYYWNLIKGLRNKELQKLLYYFIQNALFSPDPFTIRELVQISEKSDPTVRKNINTLKEHGIPIIVTKHGYMYEYQLELDTLPEVLENCNL